MIKFFAKRIGNPKKMLGHIDRWGVRLWALSLVMISMGVVWALYFAPSDVQHGNYVRIMYIHVPSAWWSMGCYVLAASFGVGALAAHLPVYHFLARGFAIAGCMWSFICLVTGSIWGYEAWGTFWVWDARLTSVLLLFFIYIGYLFYTAGRCHQIAVLRIGAWILIVGLINIPIIKYSVDIWSTLHQPASITRLAKPAMPLSMLLPIFWNMLAFFVLTIVMVMASTKRILKDHIGRLKHREILRDLVDVSDDATEKVENARSGGGMKGGTIQKNPIME